MMNAPRYRYASFADGRYSCFVDTQTNRAIELANGATAFSVHSFSRPLEDAPRPRRIWGDLHLRFAIPLQVSFADRLSKLIAMLATYKVPSQSISAYFIEDNLDVIIEERAFRGEIGSPCRFDFDNTIQRITESDPFSCLLIKNVPVQMSQILIAMRKEPAKIEQARSPLYYYLECHGVNVTTRLAEIYYGHHYRLKGMRDYLFPKHAYTATCSIFNTLINQNEASLEELAIICDLFGGDVGYFTQLLTLHGRQGLLNNITPAELKRARTRVKPNMGCVHVEKNLSLLDKGYTCHKRCGVSTPRALPFVAGHDCPTALTREDAIFSLRPTGLYAFYPEKDLWLRIMDSIWVNRIMPDTQNGLGAREIICHDIDGFPKTLVISQKDFNSSTFFSILHSHRVHVPSDNRMKGQLRAFLANQYPSQLSTNQTAMVEQSGWQNGLGYIPSGSRHIKSTPYKAKTQNLPTPIDLRTFLKKTPKVQTSACNFFLLGTLAALTAPTLALLKTPGLCLHFHGGSKNARTALLASIARISGHHLYSLSDSLQHVAALKGHHKDSTLHISEVEKDQVKGMYRFIRHYFLGRKGKDKPVSGMIISTGETELGQNGSHLFAHNKRVLAINVELPGNHSASYIEVQPLVDVIVDALTTDRAETLVAFREKKKNYACTVPRAKDSLDRQAASFFGLCAAIGRWTQENEKLEWWNGNSIQTLFKQIVTSSSQEMLFITALKGLSLIMPTKAKIGNFPIKRPREMEEISSGKFLVPTAEMNEFTPQQTSLRQWTSWLRKNKILIPNKAGRASATYYSKRQKKTIKGYLISHKKLLQVLVMASTN